MAERPDPPEAGAPLSRVDAVDGALLQDEVVQPLLRRSSLVRLGRRASMDIQEILEEALDAEPAKARGHIREWSDLSVPAVADAGEDAKDALEPRASLGPLGASPYGHTRLLFSWGRGDLGALLWPDEDDHAPAGESPISRKRIMTVAGSMYHTCGVTATGEVYACGSNDEGQVMAQGALGEEIVRDGYRLVPSPVLLEALMSHRAVAVACGLYHTLVLTAAGTVLSWGSNEIGQLGHGTGINNAPRRRVRPRAMRGLSSAAIAIAAGDEYSLVLGADGSVYSCGSGRCGGLGDTDERWELSPLTHLTGEPIASIAAGPKHAGAVAATGQLYTWGSNSHGQCGHIAAGTGKVSDEDDPRVLLLPRRVRAGAAAGSDGIVSTAMGMNHTLCVTRSGRVLAFGRNDHGQLGVAQEAPQDAFLPLAVPMFGEDQDNPATHVACGWAHSLVLTTGGELYGFGRNASGQLFSASSSKPGVPAMDAADRPGAGEDVRVPAFLSSLSPAFLQKVYAFADQSAALGVARYHLLTRTSSAGAGAPLSRRFSVVAAMKGQLGLQANDILDELGEALGAADDAARADADPGKCDDAKRNEAERDGGMRDEAGARTVDPAAADALIRRIVEVYSNLNRLGASFLHNNFAQLDVRGVDTALTRALEGLGSAGFTERLARAVEAAATGLEAMDSRTAEPGIVRILLLLWMNPVHGQRRVTSTSAEAPGVFVRLMKMVAGLSRDGKVVLGRFICECVPQDLLQDRLLAPVQLHLDHALRSNTRGATLPALAMVAHDLYTFSQRMGHLLPPEKFYSDGFRHIDLRILLDDLYALKTLPEERRRNRFFLNLFPELIPADTKLRMMQVEAIVSQTSARNQVIINHMMAHFLGGEALPEMPYLVLEVRREALVHTALSQLAAAPDTDLQKELKVKFIGEEGVDAGGVRKEFFQLIVQDIFDVNYGMFVRRLNDRIVWFNQDCTWDLENFRVIGKLLALALYNGVILDLNFPQVIYKKLLGQPLGLDDLECLDPDLMSGLKKLLEFEPAASVEDVFGLAFTMDWQSMGETHSHELVPGGADQPVTGANRQDYVEQYANYLLVDAIAPQFEPFREGFLRVMGGSKVVHHLTDKELEYLIVGEPLLDFHALEESTIYEGWEGGAADPFVRMFWEIVHGMDLGSQQHLLLFVTGTAKAPVGGLGKMRFILQRAGPDTDSLPTSRTCFNLLLLPEYASREKLHERLHLAIAEYRGFGLE